jgi:hypothetical protein
METKTCGTCRYFKRESEKRDWQGGDCRRHAPIITALRVTMNIYDMNTKPSWPHMSTEDGCIGDWERKEDG